MQGSPLVCVVIPAYNHERFVGEAIESALAQTLADIEVVVVDDGSRDDTAAVAERAAQSDRRVKVIRQSNRGSHAAINRGIAQSRSPWIAILNSDDRYHPERLEAMLGAGGERHDFVLTGARLIDDSGAPITDPNHWWLRTLADFDARVREFGPVDGLLYGNYAVSTSNFLLRRTLFEAIGPLRRLRHVSDWDYAIRAALHAPERFLYLRERALLDYRLHGGNAILTELLRGALEMGRIQRELLERFGAPHALALSTFRAQRDVRRHWRERGFALGRASSERELDATRAMLAETREALARTDEALAKAHEILAETHEALVETRAGLAHAESLAFARAERVRAIESTPAWRVLRRLRLTRGA